MKIENPWGLVIIFSAFMIQATTFGVALSFGVYIVELQRHFDVGVAFTSLIGSINVGLFLGAGPITSYLMRKMSYRKVALLGGLLSSIGLTFIPFSPNLEFMLVFYGIIAGFGFCLLYIPSHVLSGLYYDRHRSLATGVATTGSAVGGVIYSIAIPSLIELYGWRGSFFILAGINLHNIVFAALLRPAPIQFKSKDELIISCSKEENGNTKMDELEREDKTDAMETANMIPSNQAKRHKSSSIKHKESHLCNIWSNFSYIIFFVNNFLWNMGSSVLIILGPEYFTHIGFSLSEAGVLISMLSIGCCLGCVLGAVFGNILKTNRLLLFTLTSIMFGIASFFVAFSFVHTFLGIAIVNNVIGILFGVILGLLVVVTSDLVGISALGDAMGFLMFSNGLGNIIGPPFGGLLKGWSGSEESFIFLGGALNLASGVVLFTILRCGKSCNKRSKNEL